MTSLSPVLKQATPVVVDHARGSWIHGTDGRSYLDFTTGIGVTSTGHCHPKVVAAAREQVGKIIHAQYTTVMHQPLLALTEKLGEVLPAGLDRGQRRRPGRDGALLGEGGQVRHAEVRADGLDAGAADEQVDQVDADPEPDHLPGPDRAEPELLPSQRHVPRRRHHPIQLNRTTRPHRRRAL